MKHSVRIGLLLFFTSFSNTSIAQNCNCDSLVEHVRSNWTNWVVNADSIKIISIKKIGTIKTEKNKEYLLRLLASDTAWAAYPTTLAKRTILIFGRLDTLAGRSIKALDAYGNDARVYIGTKEEKLKGFNANYNLTDEYYEVYFRLGNKIIMSPAVCSKKQCTIFDNVFGWFFSNKSFKLHFNLSLSHLALASHPL